jgi:cyclopropane fatty-acyl-phospholipid synthase-like methyltransferase
MPSSSKEGKSIIREWIEEFSLEVHTVMDLGVGEGTYHKFFCRKNPILKHAKWIGIEVWQPYIELYSLETTYNHIEQNDIRLVDYQKFGTIDLVFAGDVLEHMTKEEAVSLIKKLSANAKRVIISIPIVHYPQDEVDGNPFERHVKDDWSHQEMLETFPQITKFWQGKVIGVYLLTL